MARSGNEGMDQPEARQPHGADARRGEGPGERRPWRPRDPEARRRGRLLYDLRAIATDKTIEEIAAVAEVHHKTIQRWEAQGKADWPEFHKYLKALEGEAKTRNKKLPNTLSDFVAKEDEVIGLFFPGFPVLPRAGDPRT